MTLSPTVKTVQIDNLYFHTEYFGNHHHPACLLMAGAMATARFWTDIFCGLLVNHGFFVIRYDHRDIPDVTQKLAFGALQNFKPRSAYLWRKHAIGIFVL